MLLNADFPWDRFAQLICSLSDHLVMDMFVQIVGGYWVGEREKNNIYG
jgi:hypothetical protein